MWKQPSPLGTKERTPTAIRAIDNHPNDVYRNTDEIISATAQDQAETGTASCHGNASKVEQFSNINIYRLQKS